MCVPVHCGSDVAVSEYFLYILGACFALNQIRREGVPQKMKVEVFKALKLLGDLLTNSSESERSHEASVISSAYRDFRRSSR